MDNSKRDTNTCFACNLQDNLVEAGGIYHCPNPLCTGCGATYWKVENLKCKEFADGYEMLDSLQEYRRKALETIDKMPYALGAKIMALIKTKEVLEKLQNNYQDE